MSKGNYGPGPCIIVGIPFIVVIWAVNALLDKFHERKQKNMQQVPK